MIKKSLSENDINEVLICNRFNEINKLLSDMRNDNDTLRKEIKDCIVDNKNNDKNMNELISDVDKFILDFNKYNEYIDKYKELLNELIDKPLTNNKNYIYYILFIVTQFLLFYYYLSN